MNIQKEYVKFLRLMKNLVACDEVSHYGHRSDVLAVDVNKQHIIEYEFKNNSTDLKVLEFKKAKYGTYKSYYRSFMTKEENKCNHLIDCVYRVPHRFYFVVPKELYIKEKEYLMTLKCGVVQYFYNVTGFDFVVMKRCFTRKKNLQKYPVALKNIANRLSNAYVHEHLMNGK